MLHCDTTAAIFLAIQRGGSKHTKHLKVRVSDLRWKVDTLQWHLENCIGDVMLADIGTQALKTFRSVMLAQKLGLHKD